MDLNDLYFRHQLSLIRACAARNTSSHGQHRTDADGIAGQISRFQQRAGAGAASGWAAAPFRASLCPGLAAGAGL